MNYPAKLPIILLFLLLVFIEACSPKLQQSNPNTSLPPIQINDTVAIIVDSIILKTLTEKPVEPAFIITSVKRMSCYGKCPIYDMKIYSDGYTILEKQEEGQVGFVKLLYEAYIGDSIITDIVERIKTISYFDLNVHYPVYGETIHDLPTTVTYARLGEMEQSITYHHDGPVELRQYQEFLYSLVDKINWQQKKK